MILHSTFKTLVAIISYGTDVDNSNEYEPNQNVSNSNSEENLLYYNDTSVNSNHVVVDVNKSIVCNEIETNVENVDFKYDFNMLNILTGIVTVCVFVCHVFSYHPFYFDFHSARIIFDVSSCFYLWNVNRTTT
jgi:hypothetical protein